MNEMKLICRSSFDICGEPVACALVNEDEALCRN
jgi:hypothetical protein